jgi:large subunit ribosomal protein L21
MFAVIKTGGKQYSVSANDTITVMTLAGEPGDVVTFEHVLMVVGDGGPTIGAPFVEGASVTQGDLVQEAPPAEFQAQARSSAGSDFGADHRSRHERADGGLSRRRSP